MQTKKHKNIKKAFTLIELLLVISIISLLASIVLSNLQESRERAQAVKFREEINQFINAIELYRSENGSVPGYAPDSEGFVLYNPFPGGTEVVSGIWGGTRGGNEFHQEILEYIPSLPQDPEKRTWGYLKSSNTRCQGDTEPYDYLITVSSENRGFENWSFVENGNAGSFSVDQSFRCRAF